MKQQDFCIRIRSGELHSCDGVSIPPCFHIGTLQVILIGAPYCILENKRLSVDESLFIQLFQQWGCDIERHLYGFYSVLLFDRKDRQLTVIRSPLGDAGEIYYSLDRDGVLISNRLARHITHRSCAPEMADATVRGIFLHHGFLPGSDTLVRGIMKAAPGTRVQIDTVRGEATLFPFRWHEPLTYTPAQAAAEYPALLESVVGYESRSQNEPAVTLSGGYDSNYLLYLLKSQNSHPTRAYCIGGSVGRNETAQAAQIARIYPDVRFRSALVDSDTLNHLPDIVWRLEGAVYERGVFLQYELSKLLSADGVTDILEGDGADQVMRENYQVIHQADLTRISHIWHQIPDYALKYIVLKKNMNMLASEGITPHYPYLDIRLLSCFHALRHENGTNKAFHKKIVESSVSKEVRSLLADVGGATQIRALAGRPDTEETKLEETIREQYLELFRRLFLGDLRMQYQGQAFCDLTLEECLQGGTAV